MKKYNLQLILMIVCFVGAISCIVIASKNENLDLTTLLPHNEVDQQQPQINHTLWAQY